MNEFDVIIIGGGPSGAISGIELQKKSYQTCIIDKSKFPKDKLCGGLLTQKAIDLLKSYCPDIKQENFVFEESNSVDFYLKDEKISNYTTKINYYFTERKKFDQLLIEKYKNHGGTLFENTKIGPKDIDLQKNTIKIGEKEFMFKILIGADGCNSILSKKIGIKRFDFFCIEGHLEKENKTDKDFRIYFSCTKDGYGWYFPKDGYYSIGIGGNNSDKSIKKDAEILFQTTTSHKVNNVKGAFIPSGKMFNLKKLKKNTILIGDAAGFADPITGEGIYYALLSGIKAAESIDEVLSTNSFNVKKVYLKKTLYFRRDLKFAWRLKLILYKHSFLRFFMNFIKKHKSFALFYLEQVISLNKFSYRKFILVYLFNRKKYKKQNLL